MTATVSHRPLIILSASVRQLPLTDHVPDDLVDDLIYFGDGSDGDVTVSGAVTLTRDMFYRNLTLTTGAALNPAGFRIFTQQALDLSTAPAGAISRDGGAGGAGGGATGGTGGVALAAGTIGGSIAGSVGAAGGSTVQASPGTPALSLGLGGLGGQGGAGANNNLGTVLGSAGGQPGPLTLFYPTSPFVDAFFGASVLLGGGPGGGGSSGGGSGTGTAGSGAGAGGSGGGLIMIFARTIIRGASTATGALRARGGAGGNGANRATANVGPSGAGGGAGGGAIILTYRFLQGSTVAGLIDVQGGDGGAALITGSSGAATGGYSGAGGRLIKFDLAAATASNWTGPSSVASSGITGGVAATATTSL